jgi:membrane protease YdiL (CAAX protease family)
MGTLAFYQYLRRQPTNFFDLELQQSSRTSVRTTAADDTTIYSSDVAEALTNATNATIITTTTRNTTTAMNASYFPDLLSTPNYRNMPWKNVWKSRYSRFSSILTLVSLTRAYFFTGRFSLFWEDRLYELARHVSWMTVPMHRSLCVLLGHLSWIALAGLILRVVPRPQPFFQEAKSMWFRSSYEDTPDTSDDIFPEDRITPGQLLGFSSQQSKHPQWVWWALGGYFVSSWLFNVADFVNSYAFPLSVLEQAEENSVVAKLVNPEGADLWASIVGYIAPCLTAPWWEEILYRGFLLPALVLQVGQYPLALFLHGVIFSVHHRSELAFLPLCVLGWTWGIVYTKSRNLWTTIMIHCMWNSRIFLGGWFGL